MTEFEEYKPVILRKTKKTEKEFEILMDTFKEVIELIPTEEYKSKLNRAKEISPDPKDIDYLAVAMVRKCPVWSNDIPLKKQKAVTVYSTEDLVNEFGL